MRTKTDAGELLRWDEAMRVLEAVDDPITGQLMNMANFEVMKRFQGKDEGLPLADFDLRFFMEVMRDFCSDHDNLRKVLDGQDLRMLTEEDGSDA